jgi:diaminohydroxyphosphoribosylaminopyrimidine deaminase/5-amino-6-(5-phosphoribosylamino)uracil reductase
VDLAVLLTRLAKREVSHLLIEGGGEVIASALGARAVDRIACVVAPLLVGGREAPTAMEGVGISSLDRAIPIKNITVRRLGSDLVVSGDVYWNC